MKQGMRKHIIGNTSRNYPSRYNPYPLDFYEVYDINHEYNKKYKPHSHINGRKPKWRAKRKQQRKYKYKGVE